MLAPIVLAATVTLSRAAIDRTSFPPATAIMAVPARDGVIVQRGETLTFLPMRGWAKERALGSDPAFNRAKLARAFVGGGHLFVAFNPAPTVPGDRAQPFLYDTDRRRRIKFEPFDASLTTGRARIESLLPGPNDDAAVVSLVADRGHQSFWVRLDDGAVKAMPVAWSPRDQFSHDGKWAVFWDSSVKGWNYMRAVVMADGSPVLPQEPKPPKPTASDPLTVIISFGPYVDVGDDLLDAKDVLPRGRDQYQKFGLARRSYVDEKGTKWNLAEGLDPPTIAEAPALPIRYGTLEPRAWESFSSAGEGRYVVIDLPVGRSESEITHLQYGIERWHVKTHTLMLDLRTGRRFELDLAVPASVEVVVSDSGTIVVSEPEALQRIVVRLPKGTQ